MSDKTLELEFEDTYKEAAIHYCATGKIYSLFFVEWLKEKFIALRAENAEQAKRIDMFLQMVDDLKKHLKTTNEAMRELDDELSSEREKTKHDCNKCKYNCDTGESGACTPCKHNPVMEDNYKERDK